jgi:TolB protein
MRRPLVTSLLLILLTAALLTGALLQRIARSRQLGLSAAAGQVLGDLRVRLSADARAAGPAAAPPTIAGGDQDQAIDRIAFIDGRGRVVTSDPDGGNARRLTARGGRYALPTWSPDGLSLAALGASSAGAGIYVMGDAPGAPVETWRPDAGSEPFYLFWSPDGRRLGSLSGADDGVHLRVGRRGDGAGAGSVLARGSAVFWDWQGDSLSLLIHGLGAGDSGRLTWLNLPADVGSVPPSPPELVSLEQTPGRFQAPAISSGNRYLAFGTDATGGGSALTVVDRGHFQTPLTIPYRGEAAMAWSPKAETLAFISPPVNAPTFVGSLRLLEMPGGLVRPVANAAVIGFFWSPDGRRIACFTAGLPRRSDRIQAALAPVAADALLELWVIDVSSGRSRRLSRFRPTRTFSEQVLPFFDQYARSHRIWSPDSRRLVLAIDDPDRGAGIHVVPVDGPDAGRARRVADGSIAFWSPR